MNWGALGFTVEGNQIWGVSVRSTLTPQIWEFTWAIPREPERGVDHFGYNYCL